MARPISYCRIEGCESRCVGRGLCRKHYQRWYMHGDPLATPRFDPVDVRFWRYVKELPNGCWQWQGALSRGYGRFTIAQRPTVCVGAHRFAFELLRRPIPAGLTIDHLCKNTACVNPNHMEVVTQSVNSKRANPLLPHCKYGHPYDAQNTYAYPAWSARAGRRKCRTCAAALMRRLRYPLHL